MTGAAPPAVTIIDIHRHCMANPFAGGGPLRRIAELFGSDRVLFGTDYAAVPISPAEHVSIVDGLDLSDQDRERILWRNASDLFHLM